MLRKLFHSLEDFIERQGLSLFLTLLTSAIILIITTVSWFRPDIYKIISENHVFEALVLLTLIEIVILLSKKELHFGEFELFTQESGCQSRILDLAKENQVKNVKILSSGLASRRLLISSLIRMKVNVEILIQDPKTVLDKRDTQRIDEAIDWIRTDAGDEFIKHLTMRFHSNITSLRAVVLYESYSNTKHIFVGWYTYTNTKRSLHVFGSQNPTLYISTKTHHGKQLAEWVEKTIEMYASSGDEIALNQYSG